MISDKYRILVIEDNPSDRELLIRLLSNMDKRFDVRSVGSYQEGIEEIEKRPPNLVLLDIYLPDKDGFYFLKEFHKNGYRDIPVILVSAFPNQNDKLKGFELGATDCINKPIVTEELVARVAIQLRVKKNRDDQEWVSQKTNEGIKLLYKELEKKNEALMKLDNLKNDFVNNVSHELRTPLTIIKESIALVYDQMVGPITPKQKDLLESAKRNVDRLARMINNVLDYQKLEAEKEEFNIVAGSINATVKEVGEGFRILLKNKGLNLEFQLEADLPLINFDNDKIVQVLTNLVNNAVKFTPQGSIYLITQKEGNNAIRVSVRDEGIGVKEEDIHKLFQTFSQIPSSTGYQAGGSGLGLALCKKIIESHKGKVGVVSEFGRGTTFYFILPIQERRVFG